LSSFIVKLKQKPTIKRRADAQNHSNINGSAYLAKALFS